MKIKKILFPMLLIPMLMGCGNSSNNSSSSKRGNSWNEGNFSSLSTNPVNEACSISGSLIEISTGCYLQPNEKYTCGVIPSFYANKDIRIVSSNEEVFTFSFVNGSKNTFQIETHGIGDSIIKVYAAEDDYLLFREVVKVRKYYDEKSIQDVVFDKYDIWESTGIFGNYQMSFFTVGPLSGLLYGRDDMEATTLNFSLNFIETKKIYDFSFHSFEVVVDLENSNTKRTYTELDIATTGDNILFYYEEGLLEMFRPTELLDIGAYH